MLAGIGAVEPVVRTHHCPGLRISDGDLALIHRQNTLDNGDLGVMVYGDGNGTLKKYIQRGNAVVLHPFNPDYEDLIIRGEELDHLYIAGKVVETKAKW